jgi:taurine---2-oxoglutarate transaminase
MTADQILPSLTEQQVRRDDRAHVFHSWSAQAQIDPLPIAEARGSHFWDYQGKKYLDFSSQLVNVNIGYQHPRLVAAIQEYAGRQCTIAPSFANDMRSEAARLLADLAPGELNKVFFTNGGADANEHALRMARLHTGRHKVLAAYRSYHGATSGAITLTGDPRRWASEPGMPGVVHFWGPYLYRSAFHALTEEEETARGQSPRSSWRPWSAPTGFWCRRRATSRASGRSVTSSGSCWSPTR